MSNLNYESYMASHSNEETNDFGKSNVGFFSLKQDKEEAIVRIMHDSTADFEMMTVHPVTVDGKFRNANCIRSAREDIANCPLCKANVPLRSKMYIHLVEYKKNENGEIEALPKVWERSASYAKTIKNLIDEYGPLSDTVFKIVRNGKAGSMDTTYDIMMANPRVYSAEDYPKHTEFFEGFSSLGRSVLNKTYEELLPIAAENAKEPSNNKSANNSYQSNNNNYRQNESVNQNTYVPRPVTNSYDRNNGNSETSGFERPKRFYE